MVETRSKIFILDYPIQGQKIDISYEVDNWGEWENAIERDGFADAYRETSFPLKLTGKAQEAVKTHFQIRGAAGNMQIQVIPYEVTDTQTSNPFNPANAEIYDLDFTTYAWSKDNVEISTRTKDLRALIKENETVEYAIPVANVRDSKRWLFDRLVNDNVVQMRHQDVFRNDRGRFTFQVSFLSDTARQI